ncbi:DUF4012 domain-containing protein [Patescibacteria group bacterium]|nr:MAG: DUF4012 domain-containing protein [Patescibacteria group bacterium]
MSKFKLVIVIFFVLLASSVLALWVWFKYFGLKDALVEKAGEKISQKLNLPAGNPMQEILGYTGPRTYLLLFLNNTELRPGGGFIGTYAVVRMDKAVPQVLKVEGTEILDNSSPNDFAAEPPEPLSKYLGIKRWEFRDSNWSPDFALSSAKALELYKLERGEAADVIDAVIGITPTVIEEILRLSGPVKAGGLEFTAENFTEKLEYEVEYGYAKKGISFDERKRLLGELTRAFIDDLKTRVLLRWPKYLTLVEKLLREKQIVVFSPSPAVQPVLALKKISGQMRQTSGDYLLWADANLAALKTDASITRELSYSLAPDGKGSFIATAKMKFKHNGKFDWRTTRYRDYARIYVPAGSKIIAVSGAMPEGKKKTASADQGLENGRQWFGAFISVEPGGTGGLEFRYAVAPEIAGQIKTGAYDLLVQKQIGTVAPGLTLGLDFGKSVVFAAPGEPSAKHGDTRYDLVTDLREDREIVVKFK